MSMTVVNAKIYVARIIGGASSQESLDMAGEAILRGYQDWSGAKKFWNFLLKDTSLTTPVTGVTATSGSAVVNAPSTGAFDFVNIGQTVTVAGTATLAANTTVSSYTRNSDGTIATITLSANFGGSTDANATLTFSADIPIKSGTNDYNLPNDFSRPFTARLTVTPRPLSYRDQRWWDRVIVNQTVPGTPSDYTLYNPYSEETQNYGTKHIKFDRIPMQDDLMRLRYWREFNTTGLNIDIPDEFLYQFLDYCSNLLLQRKKAQDNPEMAQKQADQAAENAYESDNERTDDDDMDKCLKSQFEMGDWNRPVWGNGDFDPYRW